MSEQQSKPTPKVPELVVTVDADPWFTPATSDNNEVIPKEIYTALAAVSTEDSPAEAKDKIVAALTLEESKPAEIAAALAIEDSQPIDAAIGTDDPKDADDDTGFTFPIKTSWAVLFEFQRQLNENTRFLENPNPLNISALNMISDNVEYHIRQMSFEKYWQMRNFQCQQTNLLLEQLRLALDPDTGDTESTDNPLRKAANKYFNLLGIGPSVEDRKQYLDMMQALFTDVSISVDKDKTGKQVANIKKGHTILVTMTETISNGLNNMTYKINPELLTCDLNNEENIKNLNNAVELCVDQATRLLERSQDKKQRRFHISGYENSPELVLRMYQSALLHELKPTIDQATLTEWDRISQDSSHSEQNKYIQAKALYDKMNEINTDKQLNKKSKLQHLKNLAVQKILKQDPPTQANDTQPAPATLHVKPT